jgi:NADH-quinone oxidoreductase subunit J
MVTLGTVYFYICAALALGGALAAVSARNPIRGAMGLLVLILAMAGLFLALHAQFLAAIQLIVYAGAIVVLFLFVIMLLGPSATSQRDLRGLYPRVFSGVLFVLAALATMVLVVRGAKYVVLPGTPRAFGSIDSFGKDLFNSGLVPFELSAALLMVAVLGAVAVAKGKQGESKALPAEPVEPQEKH